MKYSYESPKHCPRIELHTSCPDGYVDWHDWADRISATHKQKRCPECKFWCVWVPKKEVVNA